jgi:L-asparagine transporter-like permease
MVDDAKTQLSKPQSSATRQLPRVLGFRDLLLLIIGTVIGSGIFLVPGAVLRPLGNSVVLGMSVQFP